jgi:hypothetical protein
MLPIASDPVCRVERLRQIAPQDARGEGFDPAIGLAGSLTWFRDLWDSLAADRASHWRANPWVWVIRFEVRGETGPLK